jgi:hypothetical protein
MHSKTISVAFLAATFALGTLFLSTRAFSCVNVEGSCTSLSDCCPDTPAMICTFNAWHTQKACLAVVGANCMKPSQCVTDYCDSSGHCAVCTTDAECPSGWECADTNCPALSGCFQPWGAGANPCLCNDECLSEICDSRTQTCQCGGLYAQCRGQGDCCAGFTCYTPMGRCLMSTGTVGCSSNLNCVSNNCDGGLGYGICECNPGQLSGEGGPCETVKDCCAHSCGDFTLACGASIPFTCDCVPP